MSIGRRQRVIFGSAAAVTCGKERNGGRERGAKDTNWNIAGGILICTSARNNSSSIGGSSERCLSPQKKGLFGHGSKQSSWKRKTESFDYRSWSSVKKCRHLKDTESAPIDWHESVSSLLQDNRSKLPLEICCLCSSLMFIMHLNTHVIWTSLSRFACLVVCRARRQYFPPCLLSMGVSRFVSGRYKYPANSLAASRIPERSGVN